MGWVFANIWECRHVPGILKWRHTCPLPYHKSDIKYNRLITGMYATRQTPNVTLEESKTAIVSWFVCSFGSHCQEIKIKSSHLCETRHHSVQMKPLLETPSADIAFLSLECLLFGLSVFFFLWAFGMLFIDAVQGKIGHKFWTHSHINHICERIQHAAFAHAKRPNDHSHSCTSVRGASTSTNHLCRCKWKDKIRSQVLTFTKRKKVEGNSRVCVKKKCNVASWWQLPAGIKLLLCKQYPRRCKIHYFLITI